MTRKSITREVSQRYKKASKKERGRMLDEFCAITGYSRSYAAGVLRKGPSPKKARKTPVRPARAARVFRQVKFPVFSK